MGYVEEQEPENIKHIEIKKYFISLCNSLIIFLLVVCVCVCVVCVYIYIYRSIYDN